MIAAIMFTGENTTIHGVILELEESTLAVHVLQHAGPGHQALPRDGWDRQQRVEFVALVTILPDTPFSLTQKFAGNCPRCPSLGT